MSALNTFELKPLSAMMMKVPTITFCLFAAMQGQAQAVQLIGEQRTIDGTTQSTDWQLLGLSTLNMNGATATTIGLSNSTLNMNAGSLANDIRASAGTVVNIDSSQVSSSSTVFGAVRLVNSTATINNSNITNTGSVGFQAMGTAGAAGGSSAVVTNSSIRGAVGGAEATSGSELHFQNSTVQGTNIGSFGLSLQGATVTASQSTIIGRGNGVSFTRGRFDTTDGKLVLDQSSVTGGTGSAISVRGTPAGAPTVNIDVLNGSTLTGGNGNLLTVSGGGSATMNVDDSRLVGNVVVDGTSTAHLNLQNNAGLTGQLQNVTSLNVGDASFWQMTGDSQVGALSMAGGTVRMGGGPDAFYQLNLNTLDGNGTFVMATDFAQAKTDFINITGNASGNHDLLLSASGAEPVNPDQIRVVHTEGGDAQFSLVNGPVDAGAYAYDLKKEGTDWYLDPDKRVRSRSTEVATALFNTAVTVMYGEDGPLRARMGELRFEPGQAGLWVRGFGNKYNVSESSGTGYQQNQRGIAIGADTPLDDSQWMVGVMAGHSTSDLNLDRGSSGTIKSYFIGTYATWMDRESGLYFDAVAKVNRFDNEAKVTLSDNTQTKGNYNNVGGSLAAEFGRNIKLDDGWFVEPYARATTAVIQGGSYTMKNGLKVDGERSRSRMAEAGATVGRDIQLDSGTIIQPYLRAAVVHEFANNNKVSVNNQTFNNDLSGSRGKYGAGVAVKFTENFQMHADFETGASNKIDQKFGASVGIRYTF